MEYRGVIQPLPSLPEPEQRAALKRFNPTEIYTLGRDATHEDLLRQHRKGRALVVQWVCLLARMKGTKDSRYASLVNFVVDLHMKGSWIREAETDLRSNHYGQWQIMQAKAGEMLGRIAQGSKSAANAKRGRIGFGHSDKDLQTMLRIMESKRYSNDDMRIEAIRQHGVRPLPKRTWLLTRLPVICRERGLKD